MRVLGLVLTLLLVGGSAYAQGITGGTLKSVCSAPDNPTTVKEVGSWVYCQGYIDGFRDGLYLLDETLALIQGTLTKFDESLGKLEAQQLLGICQPAGVTTSQVKSIVLQHLDDHPELWDMGSIDVIVTALGEAFPCPE